MANGKSRDQYQYLAPVGKLVAQAECHYKKDMIDTTEVGNMPVAYFKI